MGDRANIVILDGWGEPRLPVYLYTHWGGHRLPNTVNEALAKRERWDDSSYLARIVFDTLKAGTEAQSTGYGISATITDNEHDLLVLSNGFVYILPEELDPEPREMEEALRSAPRISFDEAAAPDGAEAIVRAGWR